MKNEEIRTIAIAETSVIIRSGISHALKRLPDLHLQITELSSPESLATYLRTRTPDILIVNPSFGDYFDVDRFRNELSGNPIKIVALVSSFINTNVLHKYDQTISILDDIEAISAKINGLHTVDTLLSGETDTLSIREKEIIVCIVKGMTNKEIAEKLYLSVHTVITHRRNISRKLEIHSAAGLTIYAIVNKLVELGDVKAL